MSGVSGSAEAGGRRTEEEEDSARLRCSDARSVQSSAVPLLAGKGAIKQNGRGGFKKNQKQNKTTQLADLHLVAAVRGMTCVRNRATVRAKLGDASQSHSENRTMVS